MRLLLSATFAALAVTLAFGGVAAQAPVPTAVPAVVPSDLPEIGRTKSASPVCAAMRDLVIPSFAAARKADARFAETQTRLPKYAEIRADAKNDRNKTHDDVFQEMALSRIEQDAANLLGYAAFINKALGDPRLSADIKDPEVQAERSQLQSLYAIQAARAQMLAEFAARERVSLTRTQVADDGSMNKRAPMPISPDPSPPVAAPDSTAAPGMPLFSGIAFADKERANAWTRDITKAVAASESTAAKTFLPLAQRCR